MASLFSDHISDSLWPDYIEQRSNPTVTARVKGHLETGCESCNLQFTEWQRFLSALDRTRTPVPPVRVMERAYSLFDTFTPQPSVWQRFLATLVFDSRNNPIPVGARSSAGNGFHLRFDTQLSSISLWCESDAARRWVMTGQVEPSEGFWSVVATAEGTEVRADVSENGEFRLPDMAPGKYDMIFRGLDQEIVVPGIEIVSN